MFKDFAKFLILLSILSFGELSAKSNVSNDGSTKSATKPHGRVILVSGSCSSGKSSMAKVLAKKLDAKSIAFDEYVMPKVLKKFVRKHYGSFLAFFVNGFVMRNFFSTINFLSDKKKYELQKKFYADLKEGIAVEPTSKMYMEVKKYALRGRNVVVEAPLYLCEGVNCLSSLTVLNGMDVTYVLAFCPWNDLIERINIRNSCRNTKNKRELDWVVLNYLHTFEISSEYKDDGFLEYVSGSDVHKVIVEYSQHKYKRRHMQLLTETRDAATQAFLNDESYYIYPRFEYNLTVNTKLNSPAQAADVIVDYLQKKEA